MKVRPGSDVMAGSTNAWDANGRVTPRSPARSRRQFLSLVGGAAAALLLSDCASTPARSDAATDASDRWTFQSRADLRPPRVRLQAFRASRADGYVLITPSGPLIVDERGTPVWYRPVPPSLAATNLRVQQLHGQPVLTWWQGQIAHYGVGKSGEVVVLDNHYGELARVQAQNGLSADLHAFSIAPDGIGYLTAYRTIETDLRAVGGPKRGSMLDAVIQGVDVMSGELAFEWHSADHIAIEESYQKYSKSAPFDPVHVNSIELMPDGHFLVSARNTWTVYKIDRSSGEIVWRLGGKRNNFSRGEGVHFAWQHDARLHPQNVLTLFDDEDSPAEGPQSRALLLSLDEQFMRVDLIRAFTHPGGQLLAGSQGSVQILPNGDVFVGWGAEPFYTEFRRDGVPVMDGHLQVGESYRAFRYPWTGSPMLPPDIAVKRSGTDRMTVYASWNGATDVAEWEVLGGSWWTGLSPIHHAAQAGFETAMEMRIPRGVHYVAVRPTNTAGTILGKSRSVAI